MNNIFDFDFDKFSEQLNEMQNTAISKVDLKKAQDTYESLIREAADARVNLEKSNIFFADYLIAILDKSVEMLNNVYEDFKKHVNDTKKNDTVADIVDKEVKREVNENHGNVNCNCNECNDKKAAETCECKDNIEYPSDKLTAKQRRNVQNIVDEYMDEMIIHYLPDNFNEDTVDDMTSGLFEFAAWILTKEE